MILHITNDFSGSTVYKNLIGELDSLGLQQIVYNPIKDKSRINKNKVAFSTRSSEIIYSKILNKHFDRIFYRYKIRKIVRDIEQKVDFSKVTFIHAHTWYSDGGVAYLLHKKHKIPYIVAIRNSDLNYFHKYLVHQRYFGRKILKSAEKVILITVSYKIRMLKFPSLKSIKEELKGKLQIIPNGVDPYWIQNTVSKKKNLGNSINVLFIGKFSEGKNLVALQEAIKLLSLEQSIKIKLHIVGGDGEETEKILAYVTRYPDLFQYHGQIFDHEKLLNIFRACDIFAMPSKRETFGLVYVEAMLQGLPIIYRKNEGIDGFYSDKIGEAVTVGDANDIKDKLKLIINNYSEYEINTSLVAKTHDWKLISKNYNFIYFK